MSADKNIILASASPRRRELLEQIGVSFTVKPSTCEEIITDNMPSKAVMSLARQKAQDIAASEKNAMIIGSDTIVCINDFILGKPKDKADAFNMLKMLQGTTHQVFTGVCVIDKTDDEIKYYEFYSKTDVTFYKMTDAQINSYIDSQEPMDKAGAYGIQGKSAVYIEKIRGDYNTVVGLPTAMLYQTLLENGIDILN